MTIYRTTPTPAVAAPIGSLIRWGDGTARLEARTYDDPDDPDSPRIDLVNADGTAEHWHPRPGYPLDVIAIPSRYDASTLDALPDGAVAVTAGDVAYTATTRSGRRTWTNPVTGTSLPSREFAAQPLTVIHAPGEAVLGGCPEEDPETLHAFPWAGGDDLTAAKPGERLTSRDGAEWTCLEASSVNCWGGVWGDSGGARVEGWRLLVRRGPLRRV